MSSYAKTKYIKVRRHKNIIYNDFGYLLSYSQSCVFPIFVKWSGYNNSIFVSVSFGRVGVFWPTLDITHHAEDEVRTKQVMIIVCVVRSGLVEIIQITIFSVKY